MTARETEQARALPRRFRLVLCIPPEWIPAGEDENDLYCFEAHKDGTLMFASDVAAALAAARQAEREACAGKLAKLAAWVRTPGNINPDDAIDECARLLENNAAASRAPREGEGGQHNGA